MLILYYFCTFTCHLFIFCQIRQPILYIIFVGKEARQSVSKQVYINSLILCSTWSAIGLLWFYCIYSTSEECPILKKQIRLVNQKCAMEALQTIFVKWFFQVIYYSLNKEPLHVLAVLNGHVFASYYKLSMCKRSPEGRTCMWVFNLWVLQVWLLNALIVYLDNGARFLCEDSYIEHALILWGLCILNHIF